MNKGTVGAALFTFLVAFTAPRGHAMRDGWTVTRATQKQFGLNYKLQAEKVGDIVMVSMEIPRFGKLKDLEQIQLQFAGERRTPLSAPLAMTEKNGILSGRFQVGTEFVPQCSIMLLLKMRGRSGEFYSVQLKDYVTERKSW